MKRAPAGTVRRLLPLAAGVLALHLALLRMPALELAVKPPESSTSFATRAIAAPVPAPALEPAPAILPVALEVPATAAPRPRRVVAPRPPRAEPLPLVAQATPEPAAPAPEVAPGNAPLGAGSAALAASAPPSQAASPPATVPKAVKLPPTARFHYEVTATYKGLPLRGEGEIAWQQDGNSYELQMDARSPLLVGSRRQRSMGRVTAHGLVPEHFYDRARSEQAAHFDPDKGRVTFSNNQPDADWTAGMQDRLSVVLQLAGIMGGQPARFPAGSQIVVPTASTREAETWVFTVEAEEDLELPGGTVRAVKLERLPRRQYDVKVELWLAPRMDYAPVRLRLTNPNGDTVDQRWSSTDKG